MGRGWGEGLAGSAGPDGGAGWKWAGMHWEAVQRIAEFRPEVPLLHPLFPAEVQTREDLKNSIRASRGVLGWETPEFPGCQRSLIPNSRVTVRRHLVPGSGAKTCSWNRLRPDKGSKLRVRRHKSRQLSTAFQEAGAPEQQLGLLVWNPGSSALPLPKSGTYRFILGASCFSWQLWNV